MKRATAPLIVLALLVTACGDGDAGGTTTTTVVSGVSGSIHLSGGLEGRDETWVLESDGTVLGPDGYTGAIDADDRARLESAVTASDFFDLDAEYLPDDLCCDRFLYEVTLTRGGITHTVTTIDAADAPQALFDLIQTFLGAVRPA
ncbi:MAG: hypothetical protein HZA58_06275 [Acidimicrobiia bacterium]|nr:hypothetical protein [Acidimicrobiia bacterium]